MNLDSVIGINEINNLATDRLSLIDDNLGCVCLGIKSDLPFKKIDFKLKIIAYKHIFFATFLVKSNLALYTCCISLTNTINIQSVRKLINLDYFNLIIFENNNEQRVHTIKNETKYKFLINQL